jgi:hypothetical protein
MTLNRQYIPAIGKSIKMRLFSDYTERNVHVWSWLRVHSVNSDGVTVQVLNGSEPTGQILNIPLSVIAPPIGWQKRYTIHVKPEQVDTVLSWFARGIVVRQSHDMSGSMPTAFQPMDNSNSPHWQFPETTDAVPAAECRKVFRVVKVETQDVYDVYLVPDQNCSHCKGSGRRTLADLAVIRHESVDELKRKMLIPVEPYRINESLHLNGYDAETETFECHCIRGGFRKLGRSKRAKLIKEWAKDGWETRYVPYAGGFWERTRETVVQDWDEVTA